MTDRPGFDNSDQRRTATRSCGQHISVLVEIADGQWFGLTNGEFQRHSFTFKLQWKLIVKSLRHQPRPHPLLWDPPLGNIISIIGRTWLHEASAIAGIYGRPPVYLSGGGNYYFYTNPQPASPATLTNQVCNPYGCQPPLTRLSGTTEVILPDLTAHPVYLPFPLSSFYGRPLSP